MRKRGVTLTEMLIVVIMLGILASIATPRFTKMMRRSSLKEVTATTALVITAVKYYDVKYGIANYTVDLVTQSKNWDALSLEMPSNTACRYRIALVSGNPGLIVSSDDNSDGAFQDIYQYDFINKVGASLAGNNDTSYINDFRTKGYLP